MKSSEPKSELARYAFGYSDKKPGWSYWIILFAMVLFVLWPREGGLIELGKPVFIKASEFPAQD